MKTIFIMLLIIASVVSVQAQNWLTDFDKAKAVAKAEDKPIVLVFQGSDWCAPCIKLEKEIWSSAEFKEYSKTHFVLLKADFPRRKKNSLSDSQAQHNAQLAEAYNKRGLFPFVAMLDAEGKVLGETGYKKITPKEYISLLESFNH